MKSFFTLLASLLSLIIIANTSDTTKVSSEITDVTVFFTGAQVSRAIDTELSKGKHLLLVDELPSELTQNSIQIEGTDKCKILSVKHQTYNKSESEKSAEIRAIEDLINSKQLELSAIWNQIDVFGMEEQLLLENSKLGRGNMGVTIEEIEAAANFYRVRLNEIKQGKLDLKVRSDEITKEINELYSSINLLNKNKRSNYSKIYISVECETEISTEMLMHYYVFSAAWEPLYDFRVDDITEPLTIVYNANVFQSTGEDWDNVNITLSTSNPSLSGNIPVLTPWFLYGRNPSYRNNDGTGTYGTLKGVVIDKKTRETLPFVNIVLEVSGEQVGGATSDIDGRYIIKPIKPGKYDIRASYIGYKEVLIRGVQINANQTRFFDIEMDESGMMLDEVVVIDYKVPLIDKDKTVSGGTVTQEEIQKMPNRSVSSSAKTIGGTYETKDHYDVTFDDPWPVKKSDYTTKTQDRITSSNYISNTLSTRVINKEYTIEIPYSIPSDGEDYGIRIKEVSLPVEYVDMVIPKVDPDAFLTANIADWTDLDLMSGDASIYYQGTFVGQSKINSNLTDDTLSLSLGRDNEILVERVSNKEIYDKRFMGSNIKETLGLDITVKNNKSTKAKIIVEDQYPISDRKSIEVELMESSEAKVNEKTGNLRWELELEAGEKKVLTFKYSVKYPGNVRVVLE